MVNVARNGRYKKAFSKTPTINRITNDYETAATPHWCVTATPMRAAPSIVKYIFVSTTRVSCKTVAVGLDERRLFSLPRQFP
ncbi:unnamed protein product [Macrosiphum euphorbiae]|uniref:Uncharacterized protein n=1 Tax=Macrosiphum euphorbiae TaxID=13131 RepID=A0AAV0XPM9_9HEMI|nr:unnamed protein product [Macrosiphum euphorbiae]